jgi:hypothetical protein
MSMDSETRQLLRLFRELEAADRATLLAFAEFLSARNREAVRGLPAPLDIPRPERETVVSAIKRLTATYPMLNRARLLNETSALMTQHVMQGRGAIEVIEELELLFRRHYEDHVRGESPS